MAPNCPDTAQQHLTEANELYIAIWRQPLQTKIVNVGSDNYEFYNLRLHSFFYFAPYVNHLLFRSEYARLVERVDLNERASVAARRGRQPPLRPQFLLLGQAGMGKTGCLIYILLKRLQAGLPTAFQFHPDFFILFESHGVRLIPPDEIYPEIPQDSWLLADFGHPGMRPCSPFTYCRNFTVIQTCVIRRSACPYYGALYHWSQDEFRACCTIDGWQTEYVLDLVDRWGPCPRTIFDIVTEPTVEARQEAELHHVSFVEHGIHEMVKNCALPYLLSTPSSTDVPSIIYFRRHSGDPLPSSCDFVRFIPTSELAKRLASYLFHMDNTKNRDRFLAMMVSHKMEKEVIWMVRNYVHAFVISSPLFPGPAASPTDVLNTPCLIGGILVCPLDKTSLLSNHLEVSAYYIPSAENDFPGVDGVLVIESGVYVVTSSLYQASPPRPLQEGLEQ